jgi:YHS domain-containing protein
MNRNRNRNRLLLLLSLPFAALALFAATVDPIAAATADDDTALVNVNKEGVILDGYDTVAFFTDSRPVLGSSAWESTYRGAIYRFASAEHKALFDLEPAKYAPQFGAFCAYAVSVGRTAPIDVNTFSIVDGRLVVQHNARAVGLWNKDVQGNLERADKYWPAVAKNGGKQIPVD